ncbi:hypothetical protein Fmac_000221 [Flemingia macrophylla]|uniref:Uncharacterized protein n=1 Tax=Flemingia macrophylla TaxID=520843 RepID=A0ABD1NDS3_9FABA
MRSFASLTRGRSWKKESEESSSSFGGTPNVNREYLKTFRTKSYVEICNKAHEELGNASTTTLCSTSSAFNMHLTEYLLEPLHQEIVANMKVHRLLVDYFEASLEACRCCDTMLQAIHQTRFVYAKVTNVVHKLRQTPPYEDQSRNPIHTQEYSSLVLLQNNPLSIISPVQFRDIHERFISLLRRLTSKRGKIQRALTIKRVCKKLGRIGLAAAPCIASLFENSSVRLCEQLDVAAKGVYVLINELDTMSRMVKRLDDDVEHWREVGDICVKNYKCEILKRVVKEFEDNEPTFLGMLEELEEHIYLCFLTVNRSRRLTREALTLNQSAGFGMIIEMYPSRSA